MAFCWGGDGRVVVTPPRWVGWLVSGAIWALLIVYAVLLLASLVLPSADVDAWLRQGIGR